MAKPGVTSILIDGCVPLYDTIKASKPCYFDVSGVQIHGPEKTPAAVANQSKSFEVAFVNLKPGKHQVRASFKGETSPAKQPFVQAVVVKALKQVIAFSIPLKNLP
jgi:hypothetical protein